MQTLDGFGNFSRGEIAAMGAIAAYLYHVGTGGAVFLQPPVRHSAGDRMAIDAATRENWSWSAPWPACATAACSARSTAP